MPDLPARKVASAKMKVDEVQVIRFVGSAAVKFKSGSRNTLEEARTAVSGA